MVEYRTVSIPKPLADDVTALMEEVGYWPSLSAFAQDAIIAKLRSCRAMQKATKEKAEDHAPNPDPGVWKELVNMGQDTESQMDPNELCPKGWAWCIGDCDFRPDNGNCDDCGESLAPCMKEANGLMDAEQRTHKSIKYTRTVLPSILRNPLALIAMYVNDVDPDDLQDKGYDILEYLEKTTPEEVEDDG